MSKIQESNFFDVSYNIVEWCDEYGEWHQPLESFKNSTLKLYTALCHFANRYSSKTFYMDDIRLSEITGISIRQLNRARSDLVEMGLIRKSKRVGLALDYEIIIMPKVT